LVEKTKKEKLYNMPIDYETPSYHTMRFIDSKNYEVLQNAVAEVKDLDPKAMSVELGVRAGGGSALMIDTLVKTGQKDRTHCLIDPYGSILYETSEGNVTKHDYTNEMRDICLVDIYYHVFEQHDSKINVLPFIMEDTEFFERFGTGVPVYNEYKEILNTYAVVHFDGPHAIAPLKTEVDFFLPRSLNGSMFCFDDLENYPHFEEFEPWLLDQGLTVFEISQRKASYKVNK
jgi:hypothetical protein